MRHIQILPFAVVVSLAAGLGCGASKPTPQAPVPVQSAIAINAPAPPPADLSPVAEPSGIVALIRWKSPGADLKVIETWTGQPLAMMLSGDSLGLDGANADALNLGAPIDIVAIQKEGKTHDPDLVAAVSIGLRDVESARQAFSATNHRVTAQGSTYRLRIGTGDDAARCIIAPSVGPSAARLVCSDSDANAEYMYPYLTRGLPLVAPDASALHGEVRLAPVKARHGQHLAAMLPMGAAFLTHRIATGFRPLDDVMSSAINDTVTDLGLLINDIDGAKFDVNIDGDSGRMTKDVSVMFKQQQSWVAQRFGESIASAKRPPDSFWKLPADSQIALFTQGTDPKQFARVRSVMVELATQALTWKHAPEAERKLASTLLDHVLSSTASHAFGGGLESAAVAKSEEIRQRMWLLTVHDEPAERLLGILRDFSALYNRGEARKWLEKETKFDPKTAPKITLIPFTGKGIAKGAKALEINGPKGKKFIVVMPDGNRTWVAIGATREIVEKRLAGAIAKGAATLETNSAASTFKNGNYLSGGFIPVPLAYKIFSGLHDNAPALSNVLLPMSQAALGDSDGMLLIKTSGETSPNMQLNLHFETDKHLLRALSSAAKKH